MSVSPRTLSPIFVGLLLAGVSLGCDGPADTTCTSDRDCSSAGRVCDLARSTCVECIVSADCLAAGEICRGNGCETPIACTTSRQCPGLVCDTALGFCVECLGDADCPGDEECDPEGICRPPSAACSSDVTCSGMGLVCDLVGGVCVQCVRDVDCGAGAICVDRACRADGVDAGQGRDAGAIDGASDGSVDAALADASSLDAGPDASPDPDGGSDAGPDASTDAAILVDSGSDGGPPIDGGAGTLLIRGLGGPAGFGVDAIPISDDDSSAPISLVALFPSGLNFYGTLESALFMNNNGNVSFGAAVGGYSAATFTDNLDKMIAPFFGDVDSRPDGRPTQNNVHWFTDATRFIGTWHLVGYYNSRIDLLNSFQVVIQERSDVAPGDFDVEFRYELCEWTTGDASGGTAGLGGDEAHAGFAAGNGTPADLFNVPGSGMPSVIDLCTTSNVGIPGLWQFSFRGGRPL